MFYAFEFLMHLDAGPKLTGSLLNREKKRKKENHFISVEFEMCIFLIPQITGVSSTSWI